MAGAGSGSALQRMASLASGLDMACKLVLHSHFAWQTAHRGCPAVTSKFEACCSLWTCGTVRQSPSLLLPQNHLFVRFPLIAALQVEGQIEVSRDEVRLEQGGKGGRHQEAKGSVGEARAEEPPLIRT
jgi:hypothetical protein